MFNLIVRSTQWNGRQESLPLGRMFLDTDDDIANGLKDGDAIRFDLLERLPCLFMDEGFDDETAYVGTVSQVRLRGGREVTFNYTIDRDLPGLRNCFLFENRELFGFHRDFEFQQNHWAVKDVDLDRVLLRLLAKRRQPVVFRLEDQEYIDRTLVSAMMPFAAEFDPVYQTIRDAADRAGLECRRADDIWENPAVIQDVVGLIDRSGVIVCDCTGRNPNVFYEAGIAHTLGREVILMTQADHDIPFDLRHLRYVRYLNNAEGRAELSATLEARMRAIAGR